MMSISSALRLCTFNMHQTRTVLSSITQNGLIYNQRAGLKSLEEQIGLPPKPKKPLTPYFRYMKQMRPKITAENPKTSVLEIVKLISKNWKLVDDKTKANLQDEFKREQATYVELRAKYDSKLTDEQRNEMKQLKQVIVAAKERSMMKRRIRDLGKPKRPPSAFLQFLIEERKNTPQTSNETYREWHHKTTLRWKQLTESQKAVYLEKTQKELVAYRKDITNWEEKMLRLGHIDVVRHEALIDPPESKTKQKSKNLSLE